MDPLHAHRRLQESETEREGPDETDREDAPREATTLNPIFSNMRPPRAHRPHRKKGGCWCMGSVAKAKWSDGAYEGVPG